MLLKGLFEQSRVDGVDDGYFEVVIYNEQQQYIGECHDDGEDGVADLSNDGYDIGLQYDDGDHEYNGDNLHGGGWMGAAIDWSIFFTDLALR